MADDDVPGIPDVPRLARWMSGAGLAPAGGRPEVELIAGGRSNLTYRLRFPGRSIVLRRPPLGHVLPTAHDMAREHRVLTALAGTPVPAPRPLALCSDPEVIGAPFYLMEHVDGIVLRDRADASVLTGEQAGQVSERFAEMLATIHGLDVDSIGLSGFGRPEGYLARQLSRWQRQWELSATREVPGYAELVARLGAGLPEGRGGGLVHGDFRLDNMLVSLEPAPRVAAVLDWEMSTLGDPLADLGLALVYWAEPGEESLPAFRAGASVTAAGGFWRRAEVAGAYARITGRDVSRIGYYMAFGCFKLAVVLEGIHARYLQGKTVGEGFEREGEAVPSLIDRAHQLLGAGL